jgi:hypothetical protein
MLRLVEFGETEYNTPNKNDRFQQNSFLDPLRHTRTLGLVKTSPSEVPQVLRNSTIDEN